MKKVFTFGILIIFFSGISGLHAQWVKSFGGQFSESAFSGQQTFDGGYIVAGKSATFSEGFGDIWILKLTPNGDIEWERSYGEYADELCSRIRQTNDGGYILVGKTNSFGDVNWDIWVLKLSATGIVEWEKAYGGDLGEIGCDIWQTSDGGYAVIGNTVSFGKGQSDVWVLKLFADGNIEWQNTYGGTDDDFCQNVQQANDGGFIIAGETSSFGQGGSDVWVLKLYPNGDIEWQKTYGGSSDEHGGSIAQTFDGGYILAGDTSSFGQGNQQLWVLKLLPDGSIVWQNAYDVNFIESGYMTERRSSVAQTNDEGFIVRCTVGEGSYESHLSLLKLSASGQKAWQQVYGGGLIDFSSFLQPTYDGGYFFGGGTLSFHPKTRIKGGSAEDKGNYIDFWIFKVDSKGRLPSICGLQRKKRAVASTTDAISSKTEVNPDATGISFQNTQSIKKVTSADTLDFCSGQYHLSIWDSNFGTTNPEPDLYTHPSDSQVQVEANGDPGFVLDEWVGGDLTGDVNPVTITMDDHKAIRPEFEVPLEEIIEGCFIATSVYDSPAHPHVQIFQDFRDDYLLRSKTGRKIIKLYYEVSPPAAEFISRHKLLKSVSRLTLFPLVVICFSILKLGFLSTIFIYGLYIFSMVMTAFVFARRTRL